MLLNLLTLTLQIPEDKRLKNLKRIDSLLQAHYKCTPTTIKKIQKLAGSLNFICTAIPAGKVFLADLYKLTCLQDGKPHPSHHRRITKKVCEDLLIFKSFLEDCGKEEFCSILSWSKTKSISTKLNCIQTQLVLQTEDLAVSSKCLGFWFVEAYFHFPTGCGTQLCPVGTLCLSHCCGNLGKGVGGQVNYLEV